VVVAAVLGDSVQPHSLFTLDTHPYNYSAPQICPLNTKNPSPPWPWKKQPT